MPSRFQISEIHPAFRRSPPPTLLDPHETTRRCPPVVANPPFADEGVSSFAEIEGSAACGMNHAPPDALAGEIWKHSGWHRTRARVHEALVVSLQTEKRCRRFSECGSFAWLIRSVEHPTEYRIKTSACRDRFCLPCATMRARTIAHNVSLLAGKQRLRLITLTLKADNQNLVSKLKKLSRCFILLRRTELWKRSVVAGCACEEVKLGKDSGQWHPHLHVIVKGKYLPHKLLSDAWLRITGDSPVVHIAMIRGNEYVVKYVTKYASKPYDGSVVRDRWKLVEMIVALRGHRMVATFGEWHGHRLSQPPEGDHWEIVEDLDSFFDRLRRRDPEAVAISQQLNGNRLHDLHVWAGRCARPPPSGTARSQ